MSFHLNTFRKGMTNVFCVLFYSQSYLLIFSSNDGKRYKKKYIETRW